MQAIDFHSQWALHWFLERSGLFLARFHYLLKDYTVQMNIHEPPPLLGWILQEGWPGYVYVNIYSGYKKKNLWRNSMMKGRKLRSVCRVHTRGYELTAERHSCTFTFMLHYVISLLGPFWLACRSFSTLYSNWSCITYDWRSSWLPIYSWQKMEFYFKWNELSRTM